MNFPKLSAKSTGLDHQMSFKIPYNATYNQIYFDYENTSFSQFIELTDNHNIIGNLEMKINYSKNPIPQILYNAKIRSKYKNIPFEIDTKYLKSIFPKDNICPALKIPFQMGYLNKNKKNKDHSPSLDRIIPEKGYIKGNLVFVCDVVNRIKSNSTTEIIEKTLNFYKKIELTRTIK
jgi:hypothetical protein